MELLKQTVYGPVIYACVQCLSADVIVIIAQYARYPQPLNQEQHNTLYQYSGLLDREDYPLRHGSIRRKPYAKIWHVSHEDLGGLKKDPRWAKEELQHWIHEFEFEKVLCPDKLWRAVVLEKRYQKAEAFKKRVAELKAKKESPLPRLRYGQAVFDAAPCLPMDLVVIVARYAEHTLPFNVDADLRLAIAKLKPECYQSEIVKWREFFGVPPNTAPVPREALGPPRRIGRSQSNRTWFLSCLMLGNVLGDPEWAFCDLAVAVCKSGLLPNAKIWFRVVEERDWLKKGKLPPHLLLAYHEKR